MTVESVNLILSFVQLGLFRSVKFVENAEKVGN